MKIEIRYLSGIITNLFVSREILTLKSTLREQAELLYVQLHNDVTDIKIFQFPSEKQFEAIFLWHYTKHMSGMAIEETGKSMNTEVVFRRSG